MSSLILIVSVLFRIVFSGIDFDTFESGPADLVFLGEKGKLCTQYWNCTIFCSHILLLKSHFQINMVAKQQNKTKNTVFSSFLLMMTLW